jgi:hypothetical protein
MEQWWNDTDRETEGLREEACPSATLSVVNPTRTDLGPNPVLRGHKPAD